MEIYNTLSCAKEEFAPFEAGKVKFYSCGPTVYDYIHVGNARAFIVFDAFRRYLEFLGYDVDFVQNFTDIDDKMINKANELGITVRELADKFINEYFFDADKLNVKRATVHPRATEHILQIVEFAEKLVDLGYAYNVNGNVYYRATKFKDYGKLSKQNIDALESGARIEINDEKRDSLDFALWKSKKPGEPSWPSPWGDGRPGWHIECSVMALCYLGKTIDIHSGGEDLIFPHHENEIAQSEVANSAPFSRFWVHNGHVNIDNRKMSKSLGNFFTVREIGEKYGYETIRFFMLLSHYRTPINFTKDAFLAAKSGLLKLHNLLHELDFLLQNMAGDVQNLNEADLEKLNLGVQSKKLVDEIRKFERKFFDSMDDDLNTAGAIGAIFEVAKAVNKCKKNTLDPAVINYVSQKIRKLGGILGLFENSEMNKFSDEINGLLDERKIARNEKNWAKSDEIRDKLAEFGIDVKDTKFGQLASWKS
jgi:cysteinyl-tRNA synthetase